MKGTWEGTRNPKRGPFIDTNEAVLEMIINQGSYYLECLATAELPIEQSQSASALSYMEYLLLITETKACM